jgi:hypothetical protein
MITALKSDLSHFTGEAQDVAVILLPRQILFVFGVLSLVSCIGEKGHI